MEEERERTIDRFDLVRTYQNAESKEDFLYMLLNLEAVQAQSSMVSFIREVLHCMKQYARQHTLAVIKGIVSSVFPGKKENSGEVYERWEDTPDENISDDLRQKDEDRNCKTGAYPVVDDGRQLRYPCFVG